MPWRRAQPLAHNALAAFGTCFGASFRQSDGLSQHVFPLELRARTAAGSFVADELEALTPVPTTVEFPPSSQCARKEFMTSRVASADFL